MMPPTIAGTLYGEIVEYKVHPSINTVRSDESGYNAYVTDFILLPPWLWVWVEDWVDEVEGMLDAIVPSEVCE